MSNLPIKNKKVSYKNLINNISDILQKGREKIYYAANNVLVKTYWEIGKEIIEFEQKGKEKAEYGSELLNVISKDLKHRFGKGFSRRNVSDMRRFYITYPIWQTLSAKLTWSHYSLLLSVSDEMARNFYEKQCIKEKWSMRELRRHINSMLFERIALSKDKKGVLQLSRKGHIIEKDLDIVKDPYVLEFLNIPEDYRYSEKEFEQKIIDNLQMFLLELGKGFAFIKRQHRITLNNTHFYVDLVFYHRILKCFILIDLKIGKADHLDVGQMNMYLNCFKTEENTKGDNEPIGIIMAADKDQIMIEYALGGLSNKLFVSKYQLYLPNKEILRKKLKQILKTE